MKKPKGTNKTDGGKNEAKKQAGKASRQQIKKTLRQEITTESIDLIRREVEKDVSEVEDVEDNDLPTLSEEQIKKITGN